MSNTPRGWAFAAVILLAGGLISASERPLEETLPAGPSKEKAEAACLSCHEARIIVQQRLSKAAWAKEVDKMVKWGAAVDPKDRDGLIDYFSVHFGVEQSPYEAPRTQGASQGKKERPKQAGK